MFVTLIALAPKPKPKTKATTTTTPFDNYYKFKVVVDGKVPACKWTQHENQTKTPIQQPFNTAIPTGNRNNLIIVDLDVKDDGVKEFGKKTLTNTETSTL